MSTQTDKQIIRELALAYAEYAARPENAERAARIRRINGLSPDRPIVWLHEIPWNEMNFDDHLTLRCESESARAIEWRLRTALYRWRFIQADTVLEPFYGVQKAFDDTGYGISVVEHTVSTDETNNIISHAYGDQLDTLEKVEALTSPIITARPDIDRENIARTQELLGDALPVKLIGHAIYNAPWDYISRLRGVEPILLDLIERPELMHRTIERFSGFYRARFEQMEAQNLLGASLLETHCTPAYSDELPAEGFDGEHVRLKDVWFRGMAQLFSSISPQMHEEFDLAYMRPLMDRCGLSYYGCCEPLDRFIPYLKNVPNMRKIGVSPWASAPRCAEQLGGDYVAAKKPNPALVAGTFDAEAVRREIKETVEACLKYGCPYELVLKDISTVGYRPENLIAWVKTVTEVLDSYY